MIDLGSHGYTSMNELSSPLEQLPHFTNGFARISKVQTGAEIPLRSFSVWVHVAPSEERGQEARVRIWVGRLSPYWLSWLKTRIDGLMCTRVIREIALVASPGNDLITNDTMGCRGTSISPLMLSDIVIRRHVYPPPIPWKALGTIATRKLPVAAIGDVAVIVKLRVVRCAESNSAPDHAS